VAKATIRRDNASQRFEACAALILLRRSPVLPTTP
jgi:hypothetical protein